MGADEEGSSECWGFHEAALSSSGGESGAKKDVMNSSSDTSQVADSDLVGDSSRMVSDDLTSVLDQVVDSDLVGDSSRFGKEVVQTSQERSPCNNSHNASHINAATAIVRVSPQC